MRPRDVKEHLDISSVDDTAQALREELAYHEHRYHVLEYPLISARRYWEMRRELAALERAGVPVALDSPSRRLGAMHRLSRVQANHRPEWTPPVLLRSPLELRRYIEGVAPHEGAAPVFVGGARLSGVEVALTYADGFLVQGALRGDGKTGEDVTDNLRALGTVPLRLRPPGTITESRVTQLTRQALGPSTLTPVPPFPAELVIRGLVTMRTHDLWALDRSRIDCGEPPYVDPAAAVEASLRRSNPRVTAERRLIFFATSAPTPPIGIDSTWQLLGALKSWGFRVMPLAWRCVGYDETLDLVSALQQAKPSFEFPLDGGVLTLGRIVDDDASPVARSALLVFTTVGRRGRVASVYRAVGRTGAVQPVALLAKVAEADPPLPSGAPLPACTSNGVLGLVAGSEVEVLPGPVAPLLIAERRIEPHPSIGERCSACHEPCRSVAGEPFVRCDNPRCPGRMRARVLHLIGPRGFALTSGPTRQLEALLSGPGAPLATYFRLPFQEVERALPGAGERFRLEREQHRSLSLWRLLYLASIPFVGERTARLVAAKARTFDGLAGLLKEEQLPPLPVPFEALEGLSLWLSSEGPPLVAALKAAGVTILGEDVAYSAPFAGKRLVLAGRLEVLSFEQAIDEVERRGGHVDDKISRCTDFVVLGREAGIAQETAESYGVTTIEERGLVGVLRLSA